MRLVFAASIVAVACQHAQPPVRTAEQRAADSAPALEALRAGYFAEAEHRASAALERDPRSSQAAAARAIATYQQAGETLVTQIEEILHDGDLMKALDHERGRAAWQAFLDKLDAIDKDLAVVADDPQFSLELCLACWEHDWNHRGGVDDRDRRLFEIEVDARGEELPEGDARRRPTFRFDRGDADWARAMIAFQRAGAELVLAYKWNELDKLWSDGKADRIVVHLADPKRVQRARELILAGVGYADRCRAEYLAETDDDREWVPNPRQKSHPVPLEIDDAIYRRWGEITGDVRRLLASEEGISLKELGAALDPELGRKFPDAYLDVGKMLSEPTDIVLGKEDAPESTGMFERELRGVLGHGYAQYMRASPLVGRLRHMHDELDRGEDTLGHKLRYLLWLN